MNWHETELDQELAPYHLSALADLETQVDDQNSLLYLRLDDMTAYAETWSVESAVWLALAVVRMVYDILETYQTPVKVGGSPVEDLGLLVPTDHEQEIVHRVVTAYQELYSVVARTQMKASNRYWHRKAAVHYFPQLVIEVEDSESFEDDL